MTTSISTNYRALRPDEIAAVVQECGEAWKNPEIPRRQYELAVRPELEKFRRREPCVAFDPLIECLRTLPLSVLAKRPRLLDIGASSGYYSEVLAQHFTFNYVGCDFNPAFKELAESLYPGIDYDVADARALPYHDDYFQVVLSGACLMHVPDYPQAIREAARVADRYVIFHRTPIFSSRGTTHYAKDAYDVPCLEIHFNESELLTIFHDCDLDVILHRDVFWNHTEGFGHRTYLLSKRRGLNHVHV